MGINLIFSFFHYRFGTNVDTGLTRSKADTLLKINGPNCLVASETKSRWLIFLGFMFGGFAALLWVGAVLSIIGFTLSYINDPDSEESYDHLYLGEETLFRVSSQHFSLFRLCTYNGGYLQWCFRILPRVQ